MFLLRKNIFALAICTVLTTSCSSFFGSGANEVTSVPIDEIGSTLDTRDDTLAVPDGLDTPQDLGGASPYYGYGAAAPSPAYAGGNVSVSAILGVWRASVNGRKCQVATPQTKLGNGYRAAPIRCPGAFGQVRSWSVAQQRLSFFDVQGRKIVDLYPSGMGTFVGQSTDGASVVLSR